MILVTVGTSWPFARLVCAADEFASLTEEYMIIQRGATPYAPRFAEYVDSVDEAQMKTWLSAARVVISHAGAGSILSALQVGTPLILVPRMASFGEVIDNHQFELAEALAERERAVMVTNVSAGSLAEAVEQTEHLRKVEIGTTSLHAVLADWLAEQEAQTQWAGWGPLRLRRRRG
jgi:beta-1,4-N-acetylglucosaminyltransferase